MNFKTLIKRVTGKQTMIYTVMLSSALVATDISLCDVLPTYAMTPTDEALEITTSSVTENLIDNSIQYNLISDAAVTSLQEYIATDADLLTDCTLIAEENYIYEEPHLYYTFHDVEIDVDMLMECFELEHEEDILNNNKEATVRTLSNFFVDQMNVNPAIAAGIFGNVCSEGDFGEQQRTYAIAESLTQYRNWLDATDGKGYGIAQWTSNGRQMKLKSRLLEVEAWFIEQGYDADEVDHGSLYSTVIILAECTFLYDEVQSYNLFTSYEADYSVENATGRVAVIYEAFSNSSKQWKVENGQYILIAGEQSSSYARLQNAYRIYNDLVS